MVFLEGIKTIGKSRVYVLESQNSSLCTQVAEKEKRLGDAYTEIALDKEHQSQEMEMTRSHVNFLQTQNLSLLTEVGQKTTALIEAKSKEERPICKSYVKS